MTALSFTAPYLHFDYFEYSLEKLLHNVLTEPSKLLPEVEFKRVVGFINLFDASLKIFANCARKNEMETWPVFFSVVGDPKVLFQVRLTFYFYTRGVWTLTIYRLL